MREHRLGSTDITRFYTQTSAVKKKPKEKRKASKVKPQAVKKPSEMASEVSPRVQRQQQAPKTELDYEMERLKAEIQQEKQMKLVILIKEYCFDCHESLLYVLLDHYFLVRK